MAKKHPNRMASSGRCTYCGSWKRLTKDHIPPKCLFGKPRPNDLITVPCCNQCNVSASKDDEYFRLMLAMRDDAGDHPEAQKVLPQVIRSLQRPQARGLQGSLMENINEFYSSNKKGFIEPRASYDVDLQRLDDVASRIVKGLFWKESGERLPHDYEANAYNDSGIISHSRNGLAIFRELLEQQPKIMGRSAFQYWTKAVAEDKYISAWILQFYESVVFFCFTVPRATSPRS